jgi:hypothetical protein
MLVAVLSVRAEDKAQHLAIVVNKNSSLSDITSAELAKFFRAEKSKAPDGSKVVIVMQEAGRPEREAALQSVYKMSDGEFNKYFLQATFTGAVASAPRALANGRAVLKFVSETAGALGYVKGDEADDSVKVLKIDGKAPGDAGYALSCK